PVAAMLAEYSERHSVLRTTRSAAATLRHWLTRLLDLSAQDAMPHEVQDRLIDDTLLVIGRTLDSTREDCRAGSPRRYHLACRARDYMLDRKSDPPSITELCDCFRVSERTLHYAFTETYGVSPKRFLKSQRLLAVNRALKTATPGERIGDIAMRLGFWDLGYFANDYKTMFGELPSATLHKTQL
ncbi:MAG: helix-turn-helix domain-containing protein, partial [Thiogranum sp.]